MSQAQIASPKTLIIGGYGNASRELSTKQPSNHKHNASVDCGLVKIVKHNDHLVAVILFWSNIVDTKRVRCQPKCCYVNHCNFVSESCSVHSRNENLGDSLQHVVTPETLQCVGYVIFLMVFMWFLSNLIGFEVV